ncbi:TrkH family potassium uptake protein [Nitrincola tibetensis]|uniref:TrkH family potassium uptake protein n=1 Tax=Nitrincola tibetensis TaxID=2219697 RepID=A0A364NPB5_9GAMM|nr:potassium transporter TrkG [Nitrincola tibetensis]RAU18939.1 TrkH family potassium uptake protein [Nitrincola tibetensis]
MANSSVVSRSGFWGSAGGALFIFFTAGSLLGGALLTLPISRTQDAGFLDLYFTAVSAITVTGLVTLDTGSDFTAFGQIVIALLIQAGGLGYMLTGTLVLLGRHRFISLRQQSTLGASNQINESISVFRLVRFVVIFSLITTLIVSLLLACFWIPEFGWRQGIGYAAFHAVSAFNNAGFAIFSDSLIDVSGGNWVVWIHALALITGGMGFIVIYELMTPQKRLSIHSRLMIYGTLFLLILGTLALLLFERNASSLGSGLNRITSAFFQAATTRTAGFNSIDLNEMSHASHVFMMINMVIGAGPGSTAGGIRLTTFILLLTGLFAVLQGRDSTRLLGRTLDVEHLLRASGILILTLALLTGICILLLALEPEQAPLVVIFEVVSALGTVGLSLGLTGDLQIASKLLIICVMLIGKVSPVLLFTALASRPERPIRYAGGRIALG